MPFDIRVPQQTPQNPNQLEEAEDIHSVIDLYIWLSRRFPGVYYELEKAREASITVADMIEQGLKIMTDNGIITARKSTKKNKNKHHRRDDVVRIRFDDFDDFRVREPKKRNNNNNNNNIKKPKHH